MFLYYIYSPTLLFSHRGDLLGLVFFTDNLAALFYAHTGHVFWGQGEQKHAQTTDNTAV